MELFWRDYVGGIYLGNMNEDTAGQDSTDSETPLTQTDMPESEADTSKALETKVRSVSKSSIVLCVLIPGLLVAGIAAWFHFLGQTETIDEVVSLEQTATTSVPVSDEVELPVSLEARDPVGFFYSKERAHISNTDQHFELVMYSPRASTSAATTTMLEGVGMSIQSNNVHIGRNGEDTVFIADNPLSLVILSGTTTQVVYADLREENPELQYAQSPFLLPNRYRTVVYAVRDDVATNSLQVHQYDFPNAKKTVLIDNVEEVLGHFGHMKPVYFALDEELLVLVGHDTVGSVAGLYLYNYQTGEVSSTTMFDPSGAIVKQCSELDVCSHYTVDGITPMGKLLLSHDTEEGLQKRFVVDIKSWLEDTTDRTQIDIQYSKDFPYCNSTFDQTPLFSPDASYVYCHAFSLVGDTSFSDAGFIDEAYSDENIYSLSMTMEHTESIIDTEATTIFERTYNTGVMFPTFKKVYLEYEETDDEGRELLRSSLEGQIAMSSGAGHTLAWLDDGRFLSVEIGPGIYEGRVVGNNEEQKYLYVHDLLGNKTLIDSGMWDYTYLGSSAE